jgi:hypothetical protein
LLAFVPNELASSRRHLFYSDWNGGGGGIRAAGIVAAAIEMAGGKRWLLSHLSDLRRTGQLL